MLSEYLCDSLHQKGHRIIGTARTVAEAIVNCLDSGPDLIVVDIQLGDQSEMAHAAGTIRAKFQSGIPIIFLSATWSSHSHPGQPELCLRKPFSERGLHAAIEDALRTVQERFELHLSLWSGRRRDVCGS